MKTYGSHSLSWVIYLGEVANEIANTYEYQYPQDDDDKVTNYLKHVKALPKDSTSIY
ncbi:hypothetical protein ACT7DM_13605 [Bacillus cereus]